MDKQKKGKRIEEVDLLKVVELLWLKKKSILKIVGISALIGLIIAFTSRKEYTSSCKLMPEITEESSKSFGGLSSLAGLAGINLESSLSTSLSPELYPKIVESFPFRMKLMDYPIRFSKLDTTISSYDYFTTISSPSLPGIIIQYTLGIPGKLRSLISSDEAISSDSEMDYTLISKDDWELMESFAERINLAIDSEHGIIFIEVEMPDPYASTMLTDILVKQLTEEVTNYKLEKAKNNLQFIEERYLEIKSEYEEKQNKLATFVDRNKNITSSLVKTEEQRLQNDLNISYEIFKGLSSQLEQARIKVKEETPVFTILEPVRIPVDKSKPQRSLILIVFSIIGFMIGSLLTLIREKAYFLSANN